MFGTEGCTGIQDSNEILKRFATFYRKYFNDNQYMFERIDIKDNPNYDSNAQPTTE